MSGARTSLGVRLLIVCELLFIAGWICLLFQWQPGVIAAGPLAVATPVNEYRVLSYGIDEQLARAHADDANEGVIAMAFWPDSDLGGVFAEPATGETPLPDLPVTPLNQIVSAEQGLTNIASPKPAPTARREGAPVVRQDSRQAAPACPYRVTSIICGAARSTAVLVHTGTGESVFVNTGQIVGEWTVAAIADTTITLRAGEFRRALALQ